MGGSELFVPRWATASTFDLHASPGQVDRAPYDVETWVDVARGLVDPGGRGIFLADQGRLYRYPSVDPKSFRRRSKRSLFGPRPTRTPLAPRRHSGRGRPDTFPRTGTNPAPSPGQHPHHAPSLGTSPPLSSRITPFSPDSSSRPRIMAIGTVTTARLSPRIMVLVDTRKTPVTRIRGHNTPTSRLCCFAILRGHFGPPLSVPCCGAFGYRPPLLG